MNISVSFLLEKSFLKTKWLAQLRAASIRKSLGPTLDDARSLENLTKNHI